MGSFWNPVGPLPAAAYWLRRVVVAVLVALIAFVGWRVLGPSSGAASSAAPSPPVSTKPAASTTPSTTGKPSSTPKPSLTPKPTPTVSVAPVACDSSAIRVVATTDATSYSSTRRPLLGVVVTNTGTVPCLRNLGQSAVGLTITSGGVRVWSSEDCAPGGPAGQVLLAPSQTITRAVSWTRLTSKPGCPVGLPSATPNSYDVVARNESTSSAAVRFILR